MSLLYYFAIGCLLAAFVIYALACAYGLYQVAKIVLALLITLAVAVSTRLRRIAHAALRRPPAEAAGRPLEWAVLYTDTNGQIVRHRHRRNRSDRDLAEAHARHLLAWQAQTGITPDASLIACPSPNPLDWYRDPAWAREFPQAARITT
ncbi:hypothetical protein OHA25_59940 (plasmid) [Nonomuraea sp. NBC_00507]|uniref:hypothetical protein n=1 Tax=Nonomuraea sp. NBC_00507 TaxID=2976002 RepID=UPI002E173D1D